MIRAPQTSAESSTSARSWFAVYSSCSGVGLIFGFQPPLISLVLSRLGASTFAVGVVTAASLIAVMLCGPLYPWAINRLGLKRCLFAGAAMAALMLLLMPCWPSPAFWLLLRVVTGCAMGLCWIASEVWLNSAAGAASRGMTMGIYGTVFSSGTLAGAALLAWTGTDGWIPFAAGAVSLMLLVLPLWGAREPARVAQPTLHLRQMGDALRAAPIVMLAAVTAGLVESAELALLPIFGMHSGSTEHEALLLVAVFMAGNVVLQVPLGWLADRFGPRFILGLCAAASGVGPLFLKAAFGNQVTLWVLLFFWGGTLYALYSQGIALLGSVFEAAELAQANTVFVMVYCLGGIVGPCVGGMAMDFWPDYGLQGLLSGAGFGLLAGLLAEGRGAMRPLVR